MKHYTAIKESEISNTVVKEFNAAVLTATFPAKKGTFEADLYKNIGSADCLVFHNTCGPVNGEFKETVLITI